MTIQSNYTLWSICEDYLEPGDKHYEITSINRESPVVYETPCPRSTTSKIARISSYFLIVPVLGAFVISRIYRSIFSFDPQAPQNVPKEAHQDCDAIALEDCRDTQKWRKKLISIAEHNIVISGNYCGGKAFDEILQAIDLRMSQVSTLKVVLIAHPKFVKDDESQGIKNHELIRKINARYKGRFSLIDSPDGFFGTKRITNHTKCMVIDYGKYFIQGGSGIKDNFADKGVLNDPKRKKRKISFKDDMILPQKKVTASKTQDDSNVSLTRPKVSGSSEKSSLIESLLPGTFRDQDFLFRCNGDQETGKRVYREALFLASKWQKYKEVGVLSSESWDLDKLSTKDPLFAHYPALSGAPQQEENAQQITKVKKGKTALDALLQTKIPEHVDLAPNRGECLLIKEFEEKSALGAKVKTFFTGPEDAHSDWEDNLVERIQQAEGKIAIDQMYFQPSKRVMDALIAAANRGVDITIITACGGTYCPMSEKFFGDRNLYSLHELFFSTKAENRKNLHLYSYAQLKNGLHKKVVVIDDYVLAGSSNMGTKSLSLSSDHEMNFEAQSKELADQTLQIIEEDKKLSRKLKKPQLSLGNRFKAH
ncbi:MAG: phospholipase D family protein, partial [Chlamydiales bacterium]|nr:phospholipase D family protein [Chlamydiales bacterium]